MSSTTAQPSGEPVSPVVIHVPHSSRLIPDEFRGQFGCSQQQIDGAHAALVDHDTDVMASGFTSVVQFPFSRLLLDVERFWDDSAESMAAIGMGAIYSVDHELRSLERHITDADKARLKQLYEEHHLALETAVDACLATHDRCLIIDLHSYPTEKLPYELSDGHRPQLCIGADQVHTPTRLIEQVERIGAEHGFETAVNSPFAGSIVPLKHYQQDLRVNTVMLEWRRDTYQVDGTSDPLLLALLNAVLKDLIDSI
jgi:N-formylglutamate deformylase